MATALRTARSGRAQSEIAPGVRFGGPRRPRSAGTSEPIEPEQARRLALEQFCRVVFNSNEFAYTD